MRLNHLDKLLLRNHCHMTNLVIGGNYLQNNLKRFFLKPTETSISVMEQLVAVITPSN